MTNTIRVRDQELQRIGDEAIFVNNVPMNPEYHNTVGKEYPAKIIAIRLGATTRVTTTNDKGEVVEHGESFDDFNSGYCTVTSILSHADYKERVIERYRKQVAEAQKEFFDAEAEIREEAMDALSEIGASFNV